MPANLTPQYFDAEKKFRAAMGPFEKIAALEEMLSVMPKHKGTDHLRAELRTRIAKLNQQAAKKSGGQRASMMIEKEGAAQVVIVGLPNSGKSQLLTSLTNASPAVGDYPFTTQSATPGMMEYEDIKIQLIDTPPLAPQAIQWWLPPILRQADALLLVVSLAEDPVSQVASLREQLVGMRITIGDREEPSVEPDVLTWPKKALLVGTKVDLDSGGRNRQTLESEYRAELPVVPVSVTDNGSLDELKSRLYRLLDIIRVYTKAPGTKPDLTDPVVISVGATMADAATAVHNDFDAKLRYARIWGSGKHDGVSARRDHVLKDGDIIELHL
jgi:ribosome-interacting GTPase 1